MSVMDNHTHIYMSPTGDDTKSGSRDEPVRSVTKALQLVCDSRVDDGSGKPDETCICVEAGSYFDPAATITSEHTNGGSVPLVIRTTGDETATFTGAIEVDELLPVPGDIADRLAPSAREHVRMIDLSRFESIGEIVSRGFGRGTSESHPEVFIDDAPASISRWPKEGFVRIAGFPEEGAKDDEHGTNVGDSTYGFYYEDDRLEGWGSLDDVMVHGYWCWDWANTYERIESIDREKKLIKLQPPGSHWGYRKGNRYQFLNIIDEISKPGEYAVDIANRRIYLYPPDTYETIKVSVASGPALRLEDPRSVRIEGITFEGYRGTPIVSTDGDSVLVDRCIIRNIGNNAIQIESGTNHTIRRCTVYNTGDGGIVMSGGDRKSLERSEHVIEENYIHHFGQWSRCYVPAIHVHGVGMRVSKNLIHDSPHTGIIYWGNEFLIEYNEIHHVTLESGDAGAIYTGRDFTARGNVMRFNYIHDNGGEGMGSMGIYWDDCVSGQTAYGNIFVRVSRGMMMGGGRELVVENNIFVDALPAIQIDRRGVSPAKVWQRMVNVTMAERLADVDYTNPPYAQKYPELLELVPYMEAGKGVPPGNNLIARNICSGGVWIDAHASQLRQAAGTDYAVANSVARIEKNIVDYDPGFADRDNDDYSFADTTLADAIGFKPIPFDKIGPSWM